MRVASKLHGPSRRTSGWDSAMVMARRAFSSTAKTWPGKTPRPSASCPRALASPAQGSRMLTSSALNRESGGGSGIFRCRRMPAIASGGAGKYPCLTTDARRAIRLLLSVEGVELDREGLLDRLGVHRGVMGIEKDRP